MKLPTQTAIAATIMVFLATGTQLASANDSTLKLMTGFDYSSGDYGATQSTDILYVPFTAKYQTEPWTFKLTVPYIRITGPGNVVGGGTEGSIVVGGGSATRNTASGLGDVVAAVSYDLLPSPLVQVTGKVKFGTADHKTGLGTGENDYAAQLDVAQTYGKVTPFGTLGYKTLGNPPGYKLNNEAYGSLGFSYKFSPVTSGGLIYDYKQAATSYGTASQDLVAFTVYKQTRALSWIGYVVGGLSNGAPNSAVGVQVSYKQ